MAKDVGAKRVFVASCAPPIRSALDRLFCPQKSNSRLFLSHSNVYGIDMPSRTELVGYGRDTESIASAIGADLVIFQTLPDLIASVRRFNPSITTFDCSVFDGEYVTGGVDEKYLTRLESLRADKSKGWDDVDVERSVSQKLNGLGNGHVSHGVPDEPVVLLGSSTARADNSVGLHNSWKAS
jgi:amidophosphoribosyltransferase